LKFLLHSLLYLLHPFLSAKNIFVSPAFPIDFS